MKAQRRDKTRKIQSLNLSSIATDKVSQVTDFLNDNYRIEINKYDHTQMRIKSLKRPYVYPPSIDDISLHMMQEGVAHTDTIVKKLLRSPNHTKTYDPLQEYFDTVRDMRPEESQIDKLIAHLRVREFDDRTPNYYSDRAARLIRKWIVATAACAMGKHANEAALVFVGEDEGLGKTSLTKFLCPDTLHEMITSSSSDRRSFSLEQSITTNFMILYDEMCGLTPTVAEDFKKVLSAPTVRVKLKGDLCAMPRPRIASIIATTNNRTGSRHGFLHPSMGTRRFICIHLDDIDFNYVRDVDIDKLWAEAIQLSEHPDYDYKLTQEDYAEFGDVNQRYMISTTAGAVIQQAFVVPTGVADETSEWLTPTEIVAELRNQRLISSDIIKSVTPQHVGEAMRNLGYLRKMIYGTGERLYKYNVTRM